MAKVPLTTALRRAAAIVVAGVTASGAGAAAARGPRPLAGSPLLWATVNTCDTSEHPDTIGIRGSMPGSGVSAERMFMRFTLEYLTVPGGRWRAIGDSGDSGWIPVGSGKYRRREAGRNFTVRPPSSGAFRLRGVVRYERRRGVRVTARALARTSSGHTPTAGADPAGYSAATCAVKRP